MKKITALLLCFLLLCTGTLTAFAAEPEAEETNTVISVTVPDSHKITVSAENAKVFYEGSSGEEFTVARLSQPRLLIRAESGKVIKSVMINGEDVTEELHGGYLDLDAVYEDKVLTVTTEDEPVASKETYTVKGKVTLNGQPLSEVDLELRSTLKTTKTDSSGNFVFTDVELGEHSLTALKDSKVIGYLSFALKKDNKADVALLEDGTYTVSIDQNGAGVELHLVLSEEIGTLAPTEAVTVQRPFNPQTGDNFRLHLWWLLMFTSATCIVVLETYCRKKKA